NAFQGRGLSTSHDRSPASMSRSPLPVVPNRPQLACMRVGLAAGLLGVVAAVLVAVAPGGGPEQGRVSRGGDGGTLALGRGRHVRLVQIDTPELGSGECYSHAAAVALGRLAGPGQSVTLEPDPRLDQLDRYGRLLRYVWSHGGNVNLELVRAGAATVWFYHGERGRYAAALLQAARRARAGERGPWGPCPPPAGRAR